MLKSALSGLAMLLVASSFASADEGWTVNGGFSRVSFETATLDALGLSVGVADQPVSLDPSSQFMLPISAETTFGFTASSAGLVSLDGGELRHDLSLVLTGPDGEVLLDGFRLHIAPQGDALFVTGRGDNKAALLQMSAKIGYDRAGLAILMETGAMTATPELAVALGNPKIEGRVLGSLQTVAAVVWTSGDEPVDLIHEDPTGDEGGVAGGNGGTNCWNTGEPLIGPDVIVGDIIDVSNYASFGGFEAFALGTTSCNIGSANLLWQQSPDPDHPVIGQNIFKLKNGRFEQIGQGWLKHGFTALTQNVCGCGCSGQGGTVLGVGCSDPYCCGLNGDQIGLGSKADINPFLGTNLGTHNTSTGNSIFKRIQVSISDLETTAGVSYFGEAQYIAADDAASGHGANNASYRQLTLSGSGTAWDFNLAASTQREQPGLRAWQDADPTVTEKDVSIPGDGMLIVAAKATDLGTGFWHYEYAVQNLNCDRAVQAISVPVDVTATVQNIGFHDVPYHSGDSYSGTDWTGSFSGGAVTWSTQTFAQNANANALRWGTVYNFRFDANRAPAGTTGTVTLTTFEVVGTATVSTVVPASGPADCNGNTTSDTCDISCAAPGCAGMPNCGTSADCNGNGVPDECETDCNNNNIPDQCDISNGTSNDCNANAVPDECDTFATTPITSVRVATGLSQPVYATAPPGDSRLFIVEQTGAIRILSGGAVLGTPYLNIAALTSQGGERGLLGMAFDPNFSANGRFYVNYTNTSGNTVIARYNATGGNPLSNTADPASAVILKTITQDFANHNGGSLNFGPDGFLYVAMGDGGSANDPNNRAQDINSLLGKILRLDVNNPPTYVAAGNPFIGVAGADEIWAVGMRNPWRMSFDRTLGDLYIGDVGQDAHEEIDFQPAGAPGGRNYGWRCMEGTACTGLTGCTCNAPSLTLPILDVPHTTPGVCSITGGYVYRGCAIPDLQGTYFYADYCANFIRSFRYTQAGGLTDALDRTLQLAPDVGAIANVASFGEDGFGELYYCSLGNGGVYKIVPDTGPSCGNGIVEAGEECEPPNTAACDGTCQDIIPPPCVPATFTDTFEANLGWSVTNGAGLTSGAWERGNPNGTAAQPEDDHSSVGTQCFFTDQGTAGGQVGEADVDGGTTTLTSPILNLPAGGTISYWRWYSNSAGAAPNTETFRVDVSNNNGSNWVNVETIGPSGAGTSGGWIQHTFDIASFVTPSSQTRVRFVAEDLPGNGGSVVEAAVDDFQAFPADCNLNCIADTTDISNGTSEDCNTNSVPDECEGGGQTKTYSVTPAPALSIPDGTGAFVSHSFTVPDSGTITDVNLGLTLPHTWNGDLVVRLEHGGTTVVLIDRPGLPVPDAQFGFDNDGFIITLDDEGAGGSIENINAAGGVTSPPSYTPNNPLSAFDGMNKQGTWTISAADFVAQDSGSITNWTLLIGNQGSTLCPITDCNNNGVDDPDDIAMGTSQDCNNNTIPDECDIADGTSVDCDGGPVGSIAGGSVLFGTSCFGCHNAMGQGGVGFPGPNIRNKSRTFIRNKLLPPTTHPGGAHPEYDDQDFADLEAFLADNGSKGRPDRVPDECQAAFPNCDGDAVIDACELAAGTQADLDYDGIPDDCESCTMNSECDDGDFCNGVETCNVGSGLCVAGTPPCLPTEVCDELSDMCLVIPVFSCDLSSDFAAPGGSVGLDLMLSGPMATLRGYEIKIAITRTSGAGTLAPTCPSGLDVDQLRPDYIFTGQTSFTGYDCDNLRVATGLAVGVPVPAGNHYLADYTLGVSANATAGSTFEISIYGKPDTFLRDGAEQSIPYAIAGSCTLTITDCGPPTVSGQGPRYIVVTPAADLDPVALLVTGDSGLPEVDCVSGYVQIDGTLAAGPLFRTPAQWGTVYVHGDEIIPSALYHVQTDCGPVVGTTLSPEVSATTSRWGDINLDGAVNVDDILCVLAGFSGQFPFCPLHANDIYPCTPDGIINVDDILQLLNAFSGAPYPCADPCP